MLRALKLSRLVLIIILALVFVLFTLQKRSTTAPLVICLTCTLLPSGLKMALKKKAPETASEPLPMLSKKYSYSDRIFNCYLFSFIVCVILLISWTYAAWKTFIYGNETIPSLCTIVYTVIYLTVTLEENIRIRRLLLDGRI